MKNTIIWIVVLVVLVAGALWFMQRSTEKMPQSIVITLSEQSESGMSGFATLTNVNGSTQVELNLTGAPEDVAQPAHIHTGSCANIGGVVYPLQFPVNGISETMLDVSLDTILGQLPLALNIHKSPEEASIYVACGDITR